jgi:hypothetical protein
VAPVAVLLIHRLKTHCEYPLIGPDDVEAIALHSLVLRDLHADNCEIPNVILELYDLLVVFRLSRLLQETLRFQDPERGREECQLRKFRDDTDHVLCLIFFSKNVSLRYCGSKGHA